MDPIQVGPITIADVRSVLADTDPNSTNAGKIREKLGRGSFATIQKHLDTIRVERAPVVPVVPGAAPAAPADAVAAIWCAAWAQAQVLTLGRLEVVTSERDAAVSLAAAQAQDVLTLAAEIDSKTATFEAKTVNFAQELEKSKSTEAKVTALASAQVQELAALKAEIEKIKAEAASAAALAARDAQIAAAAMQAALDAQIQKYVDLKSVVDHLTPKTQV